MISFGSGLVVVGKSWADVRALAQSKAIALQGEVQDDHYIVFAIEGQVVYTANVMLDGGADQIDYETNYRARSSAPVVPRTSDGRTRVASEKPNVSRATFYSHDFTDPTTWAQGSVFVAGAQLTVTAANATVFHTPNAPLVDTYHGLTTLEDTLKDAAGRSYRVSVYVNGVKLVERDPHYKAQGGGPPWDYEIDYGQGAVMFAVAPAPTDVVTADYHYVDMSRGDGTASLYKVVVAAGKRLTLTVAECNLSTDIDLRDTLVFEVRGNAESFLPAAAIGTGAGQVPAGTKIALLTFPYKTISDLQNDAVRAYPTYPVLGAAGNWRSQTQPVTVFDWDYISSTALSSKSGMELRVYLQHDTPMHGWMGNVTFYCSSEVE